MIKIDVLCFSYGEKAVFTGLFPWSCPRNLLHPGRFRPRQNDAAPADCGAGKTGFRNDLSGRPGAGVLSVSGGQASALAERGRECRSRTAETTGR
jgi:hypothetical protein